MDAHHVVALPHRVCERTSNRVFESFRSRSGDHRLQFIGSDANAVFVYGTEDALPAFLSHVSSFLANQEEQESIESESPEPSLVSQPRTPTDPAKPQLEPQQHIEYPDQKAFVQLWRPTQRSKKPFQLRDEIIQHISSFTCCKINWDLESERYQIAGAIQANLELAKRRLQNLTITQELHRPIDSHHLCSESDSNICVRLITWKDFARKTQRDSSPFEVEIKNLPSMLVMVTTNPQVLPELKVPLQRSLLPLGLWNEDPSNVRKANTVRAPTTRDLVNDWLEDTVQQSATIIDRPDDPLQEELNVQSLEAPDRPGGPAHVPVSTRPTIRRARVPKATNKCLGDTKAHHQRDINDIFHQTQYVHARTLSSEAMEARAIDTRKESEAKHVNLKDSDPTPSTSDLSPQAASPSNEECLLIELAEHSGHSETRSAHDGKQSQEEHIAGQEDKTPTQKQNNNSLQRSESKDLLAILEQARLYTGEVRLRMNVGRLFIDPQSTTKRICDRQFSESEWKSIAQNQSVSFVFSERITSKDVEAESIVSIKVAKGRQIFSESPQERHVSYELVCETTTGEKIIIEISDAKYPTVRGQDLSVGAINLHYAKRAWDAQIAVVASDLIVGRYEAEVERIAKTFKITSLAPQRERIHWESLSPRFRIKVCRMKQETIHTSPLHDGIQLHLTRLHETMCNARSDESREYDVFMDRSMGAEATSTAWWTASVSSMKANSILEHNGSRELGEISDWSTEDITIDGSTEGLFDIADEIVARIDHVGTSRTT